MTAFQSRTEETRDDWQTPIELVRALGDFFLDPCANCAYPTRLAHFGFTKADDGLGMPWMGRVFVNPPYGSSARAWLRKLGEHDNGIALIPPRLGAKWFHDIVLSKATAIMFLRGRVAFISPATGQPVKGNNADSILVAYGRMNERTLAQSGLDGKIWNIR
jgi:phage N-6-adenine-methyltransferase